MANRSPIWKHLKQTLLCCCHVACVVLVALACLIGEPSAALGQSSTPAWSKRDTTEPVTLGLPKAEPTSAKPETNLWSPRERTSPPATRTKAPNSLPQVPTRRHETLYQQNQAVKQIPARPSAHQFQQPANPRATNAAFQSRPSHIAIPAQTASQAQLGPTSAVTTGTVTPQFGQVSPASGQSLAEIAIPGLDTGPSGSPAQNRTPRNNSGHAAGLDLLPNSMLGGNSSADTQANNGVLPKEVDKAVNSRYQQELDAAAGKSNALDALPPSLLGGDQGGASAELVPRPDPLSNSGSANDNSILGIPSNLPGLNSATNTLAPTKPKPLKAPKYSGLPEYIEPYGKIKGPHIDTLATQIPYDPHTFIPSPMAPCPIDPNQELNIYRGKFPVPVQRPIVELWRPLFPKGLLKPAKNWFGKYNLVMPHFMVYGDFRTGVGVNRNQNGDANALAFRTNLDMDLELTATERIHAFMGPLDRGGEFTRLDFTNNPEFINRSDIRVDTLFFEGDAGAIWGGLTNQDGPFDLPFSLGLIPFFYQNGIWAADAAMGAAVAIPAKHSKLLKWSNFDATFFWASDQVTTDAFAGDNNAAEFFGTAWFIEAYDGYFEVDYAFVHDDVGQHRSYHNFSVAFTKRYFHRISNSIRLVTNFDQALPRDQRTAEGHLLLIENALITKSPNTFVPYFNFFYGQGRVQSLARAGGTGILNNTGINFESDGLTGYPTLDFTGHNTVGGAVGLNLLGQQFSQQLILEFAGLAANGSQQFRNAQGDQYAFGIRYQKPLNNAWIFRTDHMFGFLRGDDDIRGSRIELRWKF
ncbi:MAG: hypothetical protein AAGG44_03580 [Planctomycetota bacterium]